MELDLNTLKTGQIVFFRDDFDIRRPITWLSTLIRFFTGAYFNHVEIVIVLYGEPFLVGAVRRGVLLRSAAQRLQGRNIVIKELREGYKGDGRLQITRSRILETVGRKYDFISLFWYQLKYQLFKTWKGRKGKSAANRLYCSEAVALVYSDLFPEWYSTDPEDLLNSNFFKFVYKNERVEL